jgi:hypothetical protein
MKCVRIHIFMSYWHKGMDSNVVVSCNLFYVTYFIFIIYDIRKCKFLKIMFVYLLLFLLFKESLLQLQKLL